MRTQDIIKLSTRMFKTNTSRTMMTILGMGVGTGAVVILVGLGFGLQGILLEQIVFGETLLSLNVTNPASKAVILNDQTVVELAKIEHIKDVSPLAGFQGQMNFNELTGNITAFGLKPSYFRYAGIGVKKGESFTEESKNEDSNKIILTAGILKLFNLTAEEALGKEVTLKIFLSSGEGNVQEILLPKKYKIKGIIDNPSQIAAYLPLEEFTANFSIPFYERAQVRVESSEFIDSVQKQIIEKGFRVTALSKTIKQANKIFQGVQAVLAIFGGIALIVSAIGMFNTMTVTLLERTGEIGIMRTIGASPRDIMILFLAESIIMSFLGGLVGITIGIVIGKIINFLLNAVAIRFGGTAVVLFRFPFLFLLFITAFSLVVGFLTGLFPAKRAASLNPLDAIRYK